MTELTITPKVADKTARFKGAVAAGEHVAVTIKGGAEWLGEDAGANLTLRVLDLVTGRTLAVFPRPSETLEDGDEPDAWSATGDDLYCELNLNTDRMVAAARHMLRVPVMFVLGDTDDPRTLYFRDRYEVEYWPERIGDTTPYDLDKWPKQIDDWTEQVAAWSVRLGAMKLSAVRTEAEGGNPGKTTITLNDGTAQADTIVEILDGQVTPTQMNAAIAAMGATKQNTLTFDAIPTEGSNNPVKSGGVHGAVKEVADAVTEHTDNTYIHVTAEQKTAWTAKYNKPSGGIPKSDLASSVQASLGKADSAIQEHQSLAAYVNGGVYDGDAKKILLKHDSMTVAEIDATAFIKDGMVDSVEITGGNLVISFNTDAGVEDIEIPLTDIFNPSNYYDKTAADGRFVQKEAGKGLVAVDAALSMTSENPVQNKAVAAALYTGFTEWEFSDVPSGYSCRVVGFTSDGWEAQIWEDGSPGTTYGAYDSLHDGGTLSLAFEFTIEGSPVGVAATRHLITPTKTSQLTNDSGFVQAQFMLDKLDSAAAYHAWYSRGYATGDISSFSGRLYRLTGPIVDQTVPPPNAPWWTEITIQSLLAAKANASDVATALAQKASVSDLPYALVTPGEWEVSGSGYDASETYRVRFSEVSDSTFAFIEVYDPVNDYWEMKASPLIDVSGTELSLSWDDGYITATRASLPGHLLDRAGNKVVVTGNTTLTLPAAITGHLRDFLVRLEISGSTVPTITFAAPTGETITYETDGDEFPVPDEAGNWVYSFTENCVAHTFAVSLKKVSVVTQGGS